MQNTFHGMFPQVKVHSKKRTNETQKTSLKHFKSEKLQCECLREGHGNGSFCMIVHSYSHLFQAKMKFTFIFSQHASTYCGGELKKYILMSWVELRAPTAANVFLFFIFMNEVNEEIK